MSPKIEHIRKVLHSNRDENSFTARLFEGILFPQFYRDPSSFKLFLEKVNKSSFSNLGVLNDRFESQLPEPMKVPVELVFVDAMLFVECVDMYSATKKGWLDKTEFDCIIFGRSPDEQIHAIVIEVKAYTDIEPKELDRQKQHLAGLKNDLFDSYNHIVLISYDNLIYASENLFKTIVNPPNNVLILTWDDFKIEIKGSDRFFEKDFHLYKTLHKDGLGNNLRHMMKK